jgi:hypothetical protein
MFDVQCSMFDVLPVLPVLPVRCSASLLAMNHFGDLNGNLKSGLA